MDLGTIVAPKWFNTILNSNPESWHTQEIFRRSLTGDGSDSSGASVICITGHKEDELARLVALRLSAKWQCNVTVSAGVHIDNAEKDEISILSRNVEELMEILIEKSRSK